MATPIAQTINFLLILENMFFPSLPYPNRSAPHRPPCEATSLLALSLVLSSSKAHAKGKSLFLLPHRKLAVSLLKYMKLHF